MSVLGKSPVHGEEFTVMYVVVAFCVIEGLGVKAHCSVFPSVVLLSKYGACGKGGCINLEKEWFGEVRLLERGIREDSFDERIEGVGAVFCPKEGMVLFSEGDKGPGDVGVIRDEGTLVA